MRYTAEAVVVAVVCLQLAPMNTRSVFDEASQYIQTSIFGPYDRIVFSQLHQRPFEQCPGVEARHLQSLQRIEAALPAIDASSRFEPLRLFRLVRLFNQESQSFYWSECTQAWTYYYSYVDYQSWLMKVAPVIWVVEQLHGSEAPIVLLLTFAAWFGIASLYWVARRLSGSSIVGFAGLAILWFSFYPSAPRWFSAAAFGPGLPVVDVRLNLFATFALVGLGQFLCDLPSAGRRFSASAAEIAAAVLFAACALLLVFVRLPQSRLDATVVILCLLAVAAARRNINIARRAVLVLILVTVVQWPFQRFSATLLGPVSAVNTAAADEFKLVNAVEFLNERPSHFGNFILDFNFTWIHDGDYYLRRLSQVYVFHHGYPAWGRRFLKETLLHHPMEIPNAWWKRFAMQLVFHEQLSYGFYGKHPRLGTAVFWLTSALGFTILLGGRRWSSAWPLLGLLFWEVYGLHTFLALMHVHYLYSLKGIWMLWCAAPCLAVLGAREVGSWRPRSWSWPRRLLPQGHPRVWAASAAVLVVIGLWFVREFRKEVHVTHVWRAVHAGLIERDAVLSPDDLVREIDAIRDLGGEGPGTVSMYGAWALFGYLERAASYTALTGLPISRDHVRQLMLQHYKRALAEGPDNPHFYTYAGYFGDPDWPAIYQEGLRRFPDHPYRVMMSWALATSGAPVLPEDVRSVYRAVYEPAVRAQLRDGESFRPGFRPLPIVTASTPVASTADGLLVTARPGEVVSVEPFRTFGTDRLALGLFLRVVAGDLGGQLIDGHGAHLADLPPISSSDNFPYRAWRFEHLDGRPPDRTRGEDDRTAQIAFVAGPQGARFVIRDLYPLIENPRWFR